MSSTIESDELVHKSYLFEVRRLELRLADGSRIQRDMIRHNGAALVLPILADGSIVMIRNYRYAVAQTLWELPCGTLEDGEDPRACAGRELTEESGYSAGRLEKLGSYCSCPGYTNEIIHAYLATDLTPGRQELETYEHITVEVLPDEKVRQMVADNTITDAKTIAALGIYWIRGA